MDERINTCIIGGGIPALVLARRLPDPVVVLDDSQDQDDGKSIVISAKSAAILAELSALPPSSRPICDAHISFFGKGQTLGGGAPFAFGIDHKTVQNALREGTRRLAKRVKSITPTDDGVLLTTTDDSTIQANRVFIACPLSCLPLEFSTFQYAYSQSVLSIVGQSRFCSAAQHFTRRGVYVLVPRADGNVGVILSAPPTIAGELNSMSDEQLSAHLSDEFQQPIQISGRRFVYVPKFIRTRPLSVGNISLLGSGATTLHPAGAQSVDLGIADALALAEQTDNPNRINAHRKAITISSTLALGAHCRALPFRLVGGAVVSLFGQSLVNRFLSPIDKAEFAIESGDMR